MSKKLHFKSLLLVALLLGGVSSAFADEVIWSEDFTGLNAGDVPTAPTNTSYTGVTYTCVDGGSATKIYEEALAGGTTPELLVGKKGDKVVGSFTAVIPLDNYAGTLTLTYYQNKQSLKVSSTTEGVEGGQTLKPSEVGKQTTTFTGITKDMTSITIVFEATTTSNVRLDNIELKGSKATAVAAPTFDPAEGSYTSAQTVALACTTDGASIYYTMGDDPADPTSESTLYTEAIKVEATTTIKAIAVNGSDVSPVVSATYTIVPLGHAGTESDPYTVADARAAIDANAGLSGVYATGIVSSIVTPYSTEFSNITFNISADGLETSDQLQAYRCKGATGVDASGVIVGDVVLIKGTLKKHTDGTYEFGSGCELITLQHPVTPTISTTPTSLAEFTYEYDKGPSDAQTFSVTGVNLTADVTLALGESSNYEMSLTEDSGYGNSLTISQTEGSVEATTVYVRLKADLAEGSYEDDIITITSSGATDKTISLTGSVTAPEAPNMTWDLSKNTYDEVTDENIVTWSSDYVTMTNSSQGGGTKASNYLGGDTNNRTSSRFYGGNTLIITPAYGYAITSIEFTATSEGYATALANSTWSNAGAEANAMSVTVTPTDGSKTISAIIGATCGFTAVKVYYEENTSTIDDVTVTIPSSKYTTFASTSAIKFNDTEVTVCIAKVEDGVVKATPIRGNIVPANTGVILYAETPAEYTGVVTTSDIVVSDNELVAAIADTKVYYKNNNKFNYILQSGEFKKATGALLKAGKAYLNTTYDVAATTGARELKIVFDGETTGIKAIETVNDKSVYDLQGRRVAAPTKGLYIINGKKAIVK